MSIDKYRFVSPGVQVAEIDLSRRTRPTAEPGPVIIGRFERGPTMRPVRVESLAELEENFGRAITGRESGDISRNGNYSAPSYAAFAANAWLANQGGATVLRLVGKHSSTKTADSGEAGWTVTQQDATKGRGGAWGMWVMPSSSAPGTMSGTLAAVWYCEGDTALALNTDGGTLTSGHAVESAGSVYSSTDGNFSVKIRHTVGHDANVAGTSDASTENGVVNFNFNPSSRQFIRKVFNTTPHNTNTSVVKTTDTANYRRYWLGETFEDAVNNLQSGDAPYKVPGADATKLIAWVAPLYNAGAAAGSKAYASHLFEAQPSKTGWVIAQDTNADNTAYDAANMPKLFRFCSLEEAEWTQNNIKISIDNIRLPNSSSDANAYGSFDVIVRKIKDSDAAPEKLESFVNCNLNPASPNYIGAQIGDQYASWSDDEKRYRYFGSYENRSKYIRVEMASAVEEGSITQELVPFGFFGMPRPKSFTVEGNGDATAIANAKKAFIVAQGGMTMAVNAPLTAGGGLLLEAPNSLTASISWPTHKLVVTGSDLATLSTPANRFFGVDFTRAGSSLQFDESHKDLAKAKIWNADGAYDASSADFENSFVFSLDDLSGSVGSTFPGLTASGLVYNAGSRTQTGANRSVTAVSGTEYLLDLGYDKFTMPLYGGFDGLDVREMEPLINNRASIWDGKTINTSYEKYTLLRAVDTVADPEIVDMNLLLVPGVSQAAVTDHMIATCERRRDAMAIIDIPNSYTPRHESDDASESSRNGAGGDNTVEKATAAFKQKGYNSSYAACYYPWVKVRAPISGLPTWSPPSVVALGAMSYGQATQAVWFAPAGFTRGGLSEGRGGLPVVGVSQRLSSKERDKLYEVNINPIAQFPAEGIVIFGQKTLQATPSALDRINVRRLLLFIKKRISNIASRLLFEPNVATTWNRFTSQAVPLLESIQTGFGLDDFRVVLDQTTTTADLIDRNTMYAKIFVKPTKAVEFIAIDFVITNAGASFDD